MLCILPGRLPSPANSCPIVAVMSCHDLFCTWVLLSTSFQRENTYTGNKIKFPELFLCLKQYLQWIIQVDYFLQLLPANILNPTADLEKRGKTTVLLTNHCSSARLAFVWKELGASLVKADHLITGKNVSEQFFPHIGFSVQTFCFLHRLFPFQVGG